MDNKKKIIIGIIAGIIFIIAFIFNLLFPPKPFIKSAHADDAALIDEYGYFVPGNQLVDSDNVVDHLPGLKGWLPDDYTYGDFLLDTATAFIGNFTATGSDVIDIGIQAIQNIIEADGLWIDTSSGFIRYPNEAYNYLGEFHRQYGYSVDSGAVGYWVPLPVNIVVAGSSSVAAVCENSGSSDIYMCRVGNNYLIAARSETVQNMKITDKPSNYVHYIPFGPGSNGSRYVGTVYTGYYYPNSGLYPLNVPGSYANNNTALSEFFGTEVHDEPYENGLVYITDSSLPINILNVPNNDGRSTSIQRNTDINNDIDNPYGGFNNIVLSPKLEDVPNNYEYELPSYPEVPHDLPEVSFEYPEVIANDEISEGLDGLSPLWVTLLTMGGSFIVLKVIL